MENNSIPQQTSAFRPPDDFLHGCTWSNWLAVRTICFLSSKTMCAYKQLVMAENHLDHTWWVQNKLQAHCAQRLWTILQKERRLLTVDRSTKLKSSMLSVRNFFSKYSGCGLYVNCVYTVAISIVSNNALSNRSAGYTRILYWIYWSVGYSTENTIYLFVDCCNTFPQYLFQLSKIFSDCNNLPLLYTAFIPL